MKVKIFHNTRCSKSRKALDILRENGVKVEIIEYLKTPLDKKDIENILKKLDMNPIDIMRKGEDIFKKLELEKHINNKQLLNEKIPEILVLVVVCASFFLDRSMTKEKLLNTSMKFQDEHYDRL